MNDTIAERIKQARINAKLSMTEVYKKTGISEGNLSEWESGHFRPTTKNLLLLSDIYDVSIDWLLKGENAKLFDMNEKNKELVSFFRDLYDQWEQGDEATRGWIVVQLRKAFPETAAKLRDNKLD